MITLETENGPIACDSEMDLVRVAQDAVSDCNFRVGQCAAHWCVKYARGRTDADFGSMVGLSGDQVYMRRRVWERFGFRNVPELRWSHFYVALTWDDADECLEWARENQATVAEMKAWRRMNHGQDLTVDSEGDLDRDYSNPGYGDPIVSPRPEPMVGGSGFGHLNPVEPVEPAGVRNPPVPESSADIADVEPGRVDAPYAPFRSGAGSKADQKPAAEKPKPAAMTPTEKRAKVRSGLFEVATLARRLVLFGGDAVRPVVADQLRELLTDVEDSGIAPADFGMDRAVLISRVDQVDVSA